MAGIALVTKGMIAPIREGTGGSGGGGGSPPVFKDENLPKPYIEVTDFSIEGKNKEPLTEEVFKVKTVKIIVDQKD